MIEPLFSVIVPAYNSQESISVCLHSILEQTFPFFEVIVCDDGSTDSTAKIAESFAKKDERVRVLKKKHKGKIWTRQRCIENSKANYVVCVDADDALESNCLEEFAKAVDMCQPDIVCCGFKRITNDTYKDEPINIESKYYSRKEIEDTFFPLMFADHNNSNLFMKMWAKAFRKDLILQEHSLLDPDLVDGGDFAVLAPCFYRAEGICVFKQCFYDFRDNKNKTLTLSDIESPRQCISVIRNWQDRVDLDLESIKLYYKWAIANWLFDYSVKTAKENGMTEQTSQTIKENLSIPFLQLIVSDLSARFLSKEWKLLRVVQKQKLSYVYKKATEETTAATRI